MTSYRSSIAKPSSPQPTATLLLKRTAAQPVTSDIPTLFIVGQFDPFSPVPEVRAASGTFPNGHVIVTPWQTTNPNGSLECPRSIRTAWWEEPTSRPDTRCFEQIPPIQFR